MDREMSEARRRALTDPETYDKTLQAIKGRKKQCFYRIAEHGDLSEDYHEYNYYGPEQDDWQSYCKKVMARAAKNFVITEPPKSLQGHLTQLYNEFHRILQEEEGYTLIEPNQQDTFEIINDSYDLLINDRGECAYLEEIGIESDQNKALVEKISKDTRRLRSWF